jgi:hypothetical protein
MTCTVVKRLPVFSQLDFVEMVLPQEAGASEPVDKKRQYAAHRETALGFRQSIIMVVMLRDSEKIQRHVDRRTFLSAGISVSLAAAALASMNQRARVSIENGYSEYPPAHSIIPVVGDGKWVWTQPPQETGYLEPRDYELKIGIQLEGSGNAGQLKATTPVPVGFPEQSISDASVKTDGCQAAIRQVSTEAAQLYLSAAAIARHQTIAAAVTMRLTLLKQYMGFDAESFLLSQPKPPKEFRKRFLYDSPGIQTRLPEVRKLSQQVTIDHVHPWHQAEAFYYWVRENISARIGNYTSVKRALRNRVGDCEERAAVFVALCRAAGIPARLVWVPNHNWAEFYLVDNEGKGHWIPAHTASYSWFGWTGVHELVIQKGDNIHVPEKRRPQRLLRDWAQWQGARPKIRFLAELKPLAQRPDEDPGPGARRKNERGEWELQLNHELDKALRDGALVQGAARH